MRDPARHDIIIRQSVHQTDAYRVEVNSEPAAAWEASSPYVVGDFVTKTVDDGTRFMAVVAGTTAASPEPTWPTVLGARVVDSGVTWMKVGATIPLDTSSWSGRWKVRTSPGGSFPLTGSTAGTSMEIGFDPPKWVANTVKAVGQQVVPTIPNGWIYQAEAGGTTHATTEPTWPTVLGDDVVDATVTWRCISTDAGLSNMRLTLVPGDTSSVDFDVGVWEMTLIDPFSTIIPVLYGECAFARKVAEA